MTLRESLLRASVEALSDGGVWAGLPIELNGRWKRATADPKTSPAVTIAAKLGPPFEAMNLDPPAQPWLSGRFTFDALPAARFNSATTVSSR